MSNIGGIIDDASIASPDAVQADAQALSYDHMLTAVRSFPAMIAELKHTGIDMARLFKNLSVLKEDFDIIRKNTGAITGIFSSEDRAEAYDALSTMRDSLSRMRETVEDLESLAELEETIDRLDLVVDSARDKTGEAVYNAGQVTHADGSIGYSFAASANFRGLSMDGETHLSASDTYQNLGGEFRAHYGLGNGGLKFAARANLNVAKPEDQSNGIIPSNLSYQNDDSFSFHTAAESYYRHSGLIEDFDFSASFGIGASGEYNLGAHSTDMTCFGVRVNTGLKDKEYELTASYNGVACNEEPITSEYNIGVNWEPGNNGVVSVDAGFKHDLLTQDTDFNIGLKREF